jgi:hypothetical protein
LEAFLARRKRQESTLIPIFLFRNIHTAIPSINKSNGIVAQVPARGNDGKVQQRQQQVMERGVRKHHAEVGIAGSDGRGDS